MATANTRRNKDADSSDLYTTSRDSLERFWYNAPRFLLKCKQITDNSFGLGDISKFMKEKGKIVVGYDLHNYGDEYAKHNDITEYGDFLEKDLNFAHDTDAVVMNPPFSYTAEFIDKSLEKWDNIFMFNRLTTLESIKRSKKFKSGEWPLRRVYIFGGRVTCPKGTDYEPTANATVYAWFWLDKNYEGEPTLTWI